MSTIYISYSVTNESDSDRFEVFEVTTSLNVCGNNFPLNLADFLYGNPDEDATFYVQKVDVPNSDVQAVLDIQVTEDLDVAQAWLDSFYELTWTNPKSVLFEGTSIDIFDKAVGYIEETENVSNDEAYDILEQCELADLFSEMLDYDPDFGF